MIEVRTQAELDKALKKTNGGKNELIVCKGDGYFALGDQSTVQAWDQSTVQAWGQSTVQAGGQSTVRAWDQSTVQAAKHTPVIKSDRAKDVKITGGVIVEIPTPTTAAEWCDFHNVEVRKGSNLSRDLTGQDVAILSKALDKDFKATHNFAYTPGSTPAAPDWDGGKAECGSGLHFSPSPFQAKEFNHDATKFVACPVLISEIVVHPDGQYPAKIKAPRCCAPVWEVNVDGERVEATT